MTKQEYEGLVRRIQKAWTLPPKEREQHRQLLEALQRQAARFEFEQHRLALYRFPDGGVQILVRHLADGFAALLQATGADEYGKAQEKIVQAIQLLLVQGAALGGVHDVIDQLKLFELDEQDEEMDAPWNVET